MIERIDSLTGSFKDAGNIRRAPGILKCLFVFVYGKPSILFFLGNLKSFLLGVSSLEIDYI